MSYGASDFGRKLGLTIPNSLQLLADEVIE